MAPITCRIKELAYILIYVAPLLFHYSGSLAIANGVSKLNFQAIILSSSRHWHNYRHTSNVLSMLTSLRELGVSSSRVISMIGDPIACNARNSIEGCVFNYNDDTWSKYLKYPRDTHRVNVYEGISPNFRGDSVSSSSFISLLQGQQSPYAARSRRLQSSPGTNLFLFMAGHGGDGYLNFHDVEEIVTSELIRAVQIMKLKGRFRKLLIMLDTCEAVTLYEGGDVEGVFFISSSKRGEPSYSLVSDSELGIALVDTFSFIAHTILLDTAREAENIKTRQSYQQQKASFEGLLHILNIMKLESEERVNIDLYGSNPSEEPLYDFFSYEGPIHLGRWHNVENLPDSGNSLQISLDKASASQDRYTSNKLETLTPSLARCELKNESSLPCEAAVQEKKAATPFFTKFHEFYSWRGRNRKSTWKEATHFLNASGAFFLSSTGNQIPLITPLNAMFNSFITVNNAYAPHLWLGFFMLIPAVAYHKTYVGRLNKQRG